MNVYSDSESQDSDEGIRFKTANVRNKHESLSSSSAERNESDSLKPDQDSSSLGPQLPSHPLKNEDILGEAGESEVFGPKLPHHLLKKCEATEEGEDGSSIGPELPPHLKKHENAENSVLIGPQLPPHLTKILEKDAISSKGPPQELVKEQSTSIGPQLPPHLREKPQENEEDRSDDEVYGPLPVERSSMSRIQIALEERALQLKMDQLEPNKEKRVAREEWMLELPEVKAAKFGLGPRQFRAKVGPDLTDRSSWTDTPDKKTKKSEKIDLKKEAEVEETRKRDEEQERISKKLRKMKNKESLLEMHQTKIQQKKKEEPTERRPFSREIDLQVNRFDEAQKKAVLKKAQLLDDRFSSGQSKYL